MKYSCNNTIKLCKLGQGVIKEYDVYSDNKNAYDPKLFDYIGYGLIYSVDGIKQPGLGYQHFFVRKQIKQ